MICEREKLTDRQQLVYEYVWLFHEQRGYCPTVRDICRHFGFRSPNSAHGHLRALKRKKWIDWEPHHGRTIRAVQP